MSHILDILQAISISKGNISTQTRNLPSICNFMIYLISGDSIK